jgi:hypothetical protein
VAVSKRLRYEILRRDNHACRYCGGTAPDVALTVDHVIPTALGGSDDPSNLVAACKDCNAGKSASSPNSPLVADVAADALRWSAAMQKAVELRRTEDQHRDFVRQFFYDAWVSRAETDADLPDGWERTIDRLVAASHEGLDLEDLCEVTWAYYRRDPFRYFCGVAWNKVSELQSIASSILHANEGDA